MLAACDTGNLSLPADVAHSLVPGLYLPLTLLRHVYRGTCPYARPFVSGMRWVNSVLGGEG